MDRKGESGISKFSLGEKMPLLSTVLCDCGCNGKLELGGPDDTNIQGADEILQVTDANSKRFIFLTAAKQPTDIRFLAGWLARAARIYPSLA